MQRDSETLRRGCPFERRRTFCKLRRLASGLGILATVYLCMGRFPPALLDVIKALPSRETPSHIRTPPYIRGCIRYSATIRMNTS
jgi:hypothetical protein